MFAVSTAPTYSHPAKVDPIRYSSANPPTAQRLSIAALLRPNEETRVVRFTQNDRQYYRFNNELVYPFPVDETEHERLDIFHALIYEHALRKQLHTVALRPLPPRLRILDVGFGTGFWMTDMAQQYPAAEVIGFDLDNAPSVVPGNCAFLSPVDFNSPTWPVDEASIDLLHMAQLCGSVSDWQALFMKGYQCLRPGSGQIEHIEIDWCPRSAQATLPAEAGDLAVWWNWMQQASELAGRPMAYREDTEELLERAGFVDVSHKRIRIPLYKHGIQDEHMWCLAHSYQTGMGHVGSQSFTGLSMALFTTFLRFEPATVEEICKRTLAVVQRERLPLFINLHIWSARRPRS